MSTVPIHDSGKGYYEIPATYRDDMRVPARVFADAELLSQIRRDHSLDQLINVTTLPGIVEAAMGMPDMHEGYGFPVGGVAATLCPDGVISPGGIGFDINCGVRLLASNLTKEELLPELPKLVHALATAVPAGAGKGAKRSLSGSEFDHLLDEGCAYLVSAMGIGSEADLACIESRGSLPGADAGAVSDRVRLRGREQLGSLGGGNHFLELQVVETIFDEAIAKALSLSVGQVLVLIHTGSRGAGHQVCTDYVRLMDQAMKKYGITVPDRQLACVPLSSPEGQRYFKAMYAAANFAFGNRHVIADAVRRTMHRFFHGDKAELRTIYDVAHNIAKIEKHGRFEVCVHRKGATRAFGPSSDDIPEAYRPIGQPIFIPGSMGTASFLLVGTDAASEVSMSSTCHGAGRAMSRGAAKKKVDGQTLRRELEAMGIVVSSPSNAELAEEAPLAYKDVDRVVEVVHRAGIAKKVLRAKPIGVVKG